MREAAVSTADGPALGMLCLANSIPHVPGDVTNPDTFPFPVLQRRVAGASAEAVIHAKDRGLTDAFARAAVELVEEGARLITGDCAYMAIYQDAVASCVDVPVALSSLLMVPMVLATLGPDHRVGVLVADASAVDPELLAAARLDACADRLAFGGLECEPHFREVVFEESGRLEPATLEAETVAAAGRLTADDRVRALVLECSLLPPYAAAVQRATGRPVYDWTSMVGFVHRSVSPQRFPRPSMATV